MLKKTFFISLVLVLSSCEEDTSKPNIQLFPDMYESEAYETYAPFKKQSSAFEPALGTVARNQSIYSYPDDNKGYELAKKYLRSPLSKDEVDLKEGERLFNIYCAVCHGKNGDGQGILVQREKFLGVPNYKDRNLTLGSIYHVIYYGRNAMGSHASQLDENERWQVSHYVEALRKSLLK